MTDRSEAVAAHTQCALCHGRGYVSDGQPEDGMMTGRSNCPGPFVRPEREEAGLRTLCPLSVEGDGTDRYPPQRCGLYRGHESVHVWVDTAKLCAALAAPVAGLDAVWAAAEAALPEGFRLTAFCEVLATPTYEARVLAGPRQGEGVRASTPAAALLDLARLTADRTPESDR